VRCAFRGGFDPLFRGMGYGFRLVVMSPARLWNGIAR